MTMFTNFLKTHQQNNKQQQQHLLLLPKRQLVTYALYALVAVALLYLFVDPAAAPPTKASLARPPWIQEDETEDQPLPPTTTTTTTTSSFPPPPAASPPYNQNQASDSEDDDVADERETLRSTTTTTTTNGTAPPRPPCDYSDGEWVPDPRPPLYDGTTCGAIKDDGRSCEANGRPDTGYIHWRWQPRRCDLPAFSPDAFFSWLRNRHMAFVGDSLARNQAESLVCLLSSSSSSASASPPELVHRDADGRFRRWVFRDHNATVSIFWSPFLVRGVEKSERDGVRYNQLFLDAFDERWMSELAAIDAVVLSAGQWFRIPSIYHEGDRVVGCYGCSDSASAAAESKFNHTNTNTTTTEMSFFTVFRDAVRRTLAEAARRHNNNHDDSREKLVALTTFSPSHFEGEWNKGAPCKKKADRELGYTEKEMRKIVVEEAAAANASSSSSSTLRFAAVDVTALANLRPDGHPGPYMRKNPFAAGNDGNTGSGRPVQHDCLHWCMPGPVDTFNQILLQTILSSAS